MPKATVQRDNWGKYIMLGKHVYRPAESTYFNDACVSPYTQMLPGESVQVQLSGKAIVLKLGAEKEVWADHGLYIWDNSDTLPSQQVWRPALLRRVDVPEGDTIGMTIGRFRVTADDTRFSKSPANGRAAVPGQYTKLLINNRLVMSDTPAELQDLTPVVEAISARKKRPKTALINGLGLGVVLQTLLDAGCEHVTAVDSNLHVLSVVGAHYESKYDSDRMTFVHADALDWRPPKGVRYDVVWHDIWPGICGDFYEDMKALHRRYGARCDWQGSWCHSEMRQLARKSA